MLKCKKGNADLLKKMKGEGERERGRWRKSKLRIRIHTQQSLNNDITNWFKHQLLRIAWANCI